MIHKYSTIDIITLVSPSHIHTSTLPTKPKLPKSKNVYEIKCDKEGYLTNLSSLDLAKLSMTLGAGRMAKEDDIDYSAGIVINKNINDKINIGDTILTLYTNKALPEINKDILFKVDNVPNKDYKLIYEIIK